MSDIETIKQRTDIVELISQYVELKNAGVNYKGLCPFHQEKSPSFMVNPSLQIFKCFGCGKGGDVFTFIQEIERVEFTDALKILAEKAGIELSSSSFKKDEKLEKLKQRNLEANKLAADFYHYILNSHNSGKKGREYALSRGLTSKELKEFHFGYAPSSKTNLKNFLVKRGFSAQELIEFGLLIERESSIIDKFRDRLLQPVRNTKGDIVGFSGRYTGSFDGAPKYLNSSETAVFKKNEILYGLFESQESIRKEKTVIMVEGNLDVVSSHRANVQYVVAPLGTAFTINQAKLLKRYADEILFCFDSDTAGINALIRALKIVEDLGIKHKVIDLKEYKDSDDMIKSNPKLWQEAVNKPVNTIEFLFKKFEEGLDLGSADGKSSFRDRALPVLKLVKDQVQKNHYKNYLSTVIGVSSDSLEEEIQKVKLPTHRESIDKTNDEMSKPVTKKNVETIQEKNLLTILINSDFEIPYKFTKDHFSSDISWNLYEILFKTRKPLDSINLQKLDDHTKKLYAEISLTDFSQFEDIKKIVKEIYKSLENLRISKTKMDADLKYINDPDNPEYIQTILKLAQQKKELQGI